MGFEFPDEYGYVVLAHCLSWVSNMYLTVNVVGSPEKARVLT